MSAMSDEAKREQIEKMYQHSREHFPEVPEISADELKQLQIDSSVVVVDVRTPAEQAVSMIPGAMTADDFEANTGDHKGSTIVTYCTIGHRSGLYAQQLLSRGFNVFNLKGAILSWTHCGGSLTTSEVPTKAVHVCKKKFALHADGYDPVW